MLKNPRISTVKLKSISKLRGLTSFWSISLEGIKIFKKNFHSFINLGLHFDLCENESYSPFVAKAGFFYKQKSI